MYRLALIAVLPACAPTEYSSDEGFDTGEQDVTEVFPDSMGRAAGDVAPDFGALVYTGGTTFRVWAPNASAVAVAGDFNGWSATANPLLSEGNGTWKSNVDGAKAGQAYQYVITHGTDVLWKSDPRARQMTASNGKSVIVDPTYAWSPTSYATPAWNDTVIYEMHIGTFNDLQGGAPGTWKTAMSKLAHLQALGVDAVEVMPPFEFPGDYSWGYNPAYPYAPESAYGSPADMKAFIDAAHNKGIAVILDVVDNHWGPSDLSMWCFDGESYGKGGIYFYTDSRSESGWGPRPDFGRAEVRDYIVDNALMWLNEYRADGLRWDSTINIRKANGSDIGDGWWMMQDANNAVDVTQPWKLMIAEDLSNEPWITKTTGSGGAGFDSQWDAGFFHPVDDAILATWDSQRSMTAVAGAIGHIDNGTATSRVIYTESHDEVANGKQRIPQMIDGSNPGSWLARKRSTLGAAIALTSPGIPMIFQGQEFLEDGWFQDSDPLDWSKTTTYSGVLKMYTDLIHLRRNTSSTTNGLKGNNVNVFHVNDSDKMLAFHRWQNGGAHDDVVVVANFANKAWTSYDIGLPRSGTWNVRLNSDSTYYGSDFGNYGSSSVTAVSGGRDGLAFHGTIQIAPYSVLILSQ
jgi:1,4-alpha-glucan branching enzyme